jgi:hypothetical protein
VVGARETVLGGAAGDEGGEGKHVGFLSVGPPGGRIGLVLKRFIPYSETIQTPIGERR